MRKNTREAVTAFDRRESANPAESIWTDGDTLFSYRTAIATYADDGRVIFNEAPFSPTTSEKQTGFLDYWGADNPALVKVEVHKRGATRNDLFAAAGLTVG